MGNNRLQAIENKKDGFLAFPGFGFSWNTQEEYYHPGGLFARVGQVGVGFGISPDPPNPKGNDGIKIPCTDLYVKYVSPEFGFRIVGNPPAPAAAEVVSMEEEVELRTRKKRGFKFKIRVANPSFRRLISGAIAGAVSRTAVAPLETIRTHLMVGSSGESTTEVFHNIMKVEGWKGLFRGNLVNVIRVAPSKAIEVSASDLIVYSFVYNNTSLLHFVIMFFTLGKLQCFV